MANQTEPPKYYSYVRFSAPEQEEGDSERRQIARAQKWADDNNMILDDNLIVDRGLSGYKGAHATVQGALGQFIKRINEGEVPKGSFF